MSENQQQIDYWNGDAGHTWASIQDRLDAMFAPLTEQLIEAAAPRSGERIIDVGCGCGETTIALADAGAEAWGVDISRPMLERAVERAGDRANLRFTETDASTFRFAPEHDLVCSRFGVMFFSDPTSAFANLRASLKTSGRLAFLCWRKPTDNPWMSVAGRAVQPFLPEPAEPPDPRAPGPFAFADPDYMEKVLADAGFEGIDIAPIDLDLHIAPDVDSAIALLSRVGPVARIVQELSGTDREAAVAAAADALRPHVTDRGLEMGAAVWLIRATHS